jgi:predicted PurR-regulated permease PerM
MLERWTEFRQRQRAALRASNHPHQASPQHERTAQDAAVVPEAAAPTSAAADSAPLGVLTGPAATDPGQGTAGDRAAAHGADPEEPEDLKYGRIGKPMNRQSPFYIGFLGALGALIAIGLWHSIGRLTTTLTILVIALFLTLALNPIVEWFTRRGMKRGYAVLSVFVGLIAVFVLLGFVVVPPVVSQATALTQAAPGYLQQVLDARWVKDLDKSYHVIEKIQAEFTKKVQDPNFLSQVFGGVLGAGRAVASGVFEVFTILILTLYFLSSLPRVKQAAYEMVPATRRPRFISLSEEIMRRVGSYAIGQVAVAGVNAIASWIMMTIVGIPYAAVLAVAVGFLGLVPMVGATLGAVVVSTVAFFDEPRKAVIAIIYYLVYQQLENYVVAPRIMQRTVSVPGAVTVVAALAGATLLGMLGALLAIPVAAGLLLLYEEVLVPRQRQH